MSLNNGDLIRWNRVSVGFGGILWMLMVFASIRGWLVLSDLEVILLLALLFITPLAVPLISFSRKNRLSGALYRLVILLQPFAALIGGASFLAGAGLLAGAAAAVWFLFTAVIAVLGIARLSRKGGVSLADVCLSAALVYLPIGGAWLVVARLGLQPLGFSQTTVQLTAVHFHFITLAALIITGLIGQAVQAGAAQTVYRVAAIGMLVNPLLVAAGITLTQLTGVRFLESAAAVLLALSLMLLALFSLRFILPITSPLLARGLVAVSSAVVFCAMVFACAYAFGEATKAWTIPIAVMIAAHGWMNALGFGLCGLLGWRLKLAAR
jgi:hypothetical protein